MVAIEDEQCVFRKFGQGLGPFVIEMDRDIDIDRIGIKNLDIEITEQRFSRDELYGADEVFLTGTAAEITPVREIDQRAIGKGKAGLLTQKLQALFQDIVQGKGPQYTQAWLEPIE